jgi:hypothetical protein
MKYNEIHEKTQTHICSCGKEYKDRAGLWRHKKKCSQPTENEKEIEKVGTDDSIKNETILQLIKQNQEFQNIILEQNQKNQEISPKKRT